ncbi:uncharacterized protein VTP21DRAFT_7046 [Calcarisporiella thermophila]|uniref:uncharacterized protein n=1 Tax=Calcarisporiella thermophila TaxID=911321 RepID=UPI0037444081
MEPYALGVLGDGASAPQSPAHQRGLGEGEGEGEGGGEALTLRLPSPAAAAAAAPRPPTCPSPRQLSGCIAD